MTSLEFIEKEIEHWEKVIKHQPSSNNIQKHLNDKLQTLYQIKTELEAWEVCKKFIVNLGGEYELCIDNWYNVNEYQTLKKALEVKEDE